MARVQLSGSKKQFAAGTVNARPRVRVYSRPKWEGQWQPALFLWPIQAAIAAAPMKSTATFEWLVGRMKNADSNTFGLQKDLDLRDNFVKVVRLADSSSPGAKDSILFVGRIGDSDLDVHGVGSTDTGQLVARGRRVHRAIGLEHELDRSPIRDSFVTNDGTAGFYVDAPLVFNEHFEGPSGLSKVGNRSTATIPRPDDPDRKAHAFAGAKGQTSPWTIADIVSHLLVFHTPASMKLTLGGATKALEALVLPKVDLSGRTVFQALNYLIDRTRGLGWCLRHAEDASGALTFEIHVYSVLDEPVQFEDATIEANPEKVRMELDGGDHLIDEQGLQLDTVGRFGKIVVSGQRVLSCFSLSVRDETLQRGWTQGEQDAYKNASGTDEEPKNRTARAADELAHVFRHFHVPKVFAWRTAGGDGLAKVNANPLLGADGKFKVTDSPQSPIRDWGHRFSRHLPFVKTQAKDDTEPEYLEPFVLVKDGTGAWVYAHDAAPKGGGSATIRMLDTTFGLEVRFTPNHLLAKNYWTGSPKKTDVQPAYDDRDMIATVAARLDARLRVIVELDAGGLLKDRVLHIEIPDAELHYVVPGTVKGVNPAGVLQYSTVADAIVRDDGERLRRVAAMAKAWYGKDRAAMGITVNDLWQQYPVGSLVLSVTDKLRSKTVNTPVSQVIYDLVRMKTTIRTNWSEMDVTAGRSAGRRRT